MYENIYCIPKREGIEERKKNITRYINIPASGEWKVTDNGRCKVIPSPNPWTEEK